MSEQTLPKTYDFRAAEGRIYAWWEQSGYFQPSNDPNTQDFDPAIEPFVITIPPSPVVMCLPWQKLKTPMWPQVPASPKPA